MSFKTNEQTDKSVYEYLLSLNCPRALTVWLLYTSGEHDQLANLDWDPLDYDSLVSTRDSLAATKFLSKADFLRTTYDRKEVALKKFFEAEQHCADTNKRLLRSRFSNPLTCSLLYVMSQKISNVLGDIDIEEFVDSCNWGPGASTSCKRRNANYPNKYHSSREISASAYYFVKDWIALAYPSWDLGFMSIVSGSKIVTVPKNSKTDRTIAIEPDLNIWFQKGVGSMIRRRLHRVGIDLNDQSVNQELAFRASLDDSLATVDFSAASDTISLELCSEILPRDWYNLIYSLRSFSGSVGSRTVRFEKVSSMGNGFTFELESLIFWALSVSVSEHLGLSTKDISVFGDDVILPVGAFDVFSSVAADLGFTVNRDKSFAQTYFRESCGSYYYRGVDVKPIYLKGILETQEDIVKLSNAIRQLSSRRLSGLGCDRRLRRVWVYLTSLLGRNCPRIPVGYGDIGLIVNYDEVDPTTISPLSDGHEGFRIKTWSFRPVQHDEVHHWGVFLSKVRQIGSEAESTGNLIPRSNLVARHRTMTRIPMWSDIGDWF